MVKMVIGEVQAQTSEVKSYCNKMIQNLENVSNATSSIGLAVGLQGQAFQSIKSYLSTAYPALAKALILYSESVATANENYLQAYTGKFGAKDLDSDKLQQQIEDKNSLLQGLHDQKESIESFQRNLPASTEVFFRVACREMIQTLSSSINRNMAAKSKLEKKLEDFLEFNSHSPSYFEEANSLYGTVSSALSSLGVGKDGQISTGSWNGHGFNSFPNGWISEVNEKWAKYEEKHKISVSYTVKKIDTGYGIYYQVIRNNFYIDEEATKAYNELIYEAEWEKLKNKFQTAKEVLDKASFLVGNLIKIGGGAITTITGVVGITGSFAVVEVVGGGTATVLIPEVALATSAIATAGGAIVIDGWNNLQEGYQDNVMYSNNGKITSKTFGKPIEGVVNGKKANIRVDAEPDANKIQIQTGSGQNSPLDERIIIENITDKKSIYNLISKKVKKAIGKGKLDQLVNNIWKAYIWLKTK